jgi:hypothetical protein
MRCQLRTATPRGDNGLCHSQKSLVDNVSVRKQPSHFSFTDKSYGFEDSVYVGLVRFNDPAPYTEPAHEFACNRKWQKVNKYRDEMRLDEKPFIGRLYIILRSNATYFIRKCDLIIKIADVLDNRIRIGDIETIVGIG